MKTIRYRSGMPYILSGLVVLLYAFVFGLGSPLGYVGALLLAYLAYSPLTRLFPDRYAVVEDLPKAKDQAADALIQECAPHLRAIRAAGDVIYDPWLLEKVDVIVIGYRSLLRALSEDADLTEPLSGYLRYLLPNTGMLLNVRVKLQDRQLDADKVNTRKRIDEALIAIEQSLGRELALIEQGEPLKVKQDILRMKTMLGQTGILMPEETTVAADAAFLASIPERTPEELIAEQMTAQRASLLQVLRDRMAAMQPQSFTSIEEPSVYAASMATPAEALVVPIAPEPPVTRFQPEEFQPQSAEEMAGQEEQQWVPQLSLPLMEPWAVPAVAPEASHAEEDGDIRATRERLVDLLDEVVLKLEREARQEQADKQPQSNFAPVTEPVALDHLITGAQDAFLSEDTRSAEKWYQPSVNEAGTEETKEPDQATDLTSSMSSYFAPSQQEIHTNVAEGDIPANPDEPEPETPETQKPVKLGGDNIISAWWSGPAATSLSEEKEAADAQTNTSEATPSLWAIPTEATDVPSGITEDAINLETAENAVNPEPATTAWASTEPETLEAPTDESSIDEEPEESSIDTAPEVTVWKDAEPAVSETERATETVPVETIMQEPVVDITPEEAPERLQAEQEQHKVEFNEPLPDDSTQPVEAFVQDEEGVRPVVEEHLDSEMPEHSAEASQAASETTTIPQKPEMEAETQSEAPVMETDAQPEETQAATRPALDALPQAGAWFSLEGFEDEDDLPLYKVAKPFTWVPPATSPRTAFTNMGKPRKGDDTLHESPGSGQERTDVPSVVENADDWKPASWLDDPALQEEKSAENLAGVMQYAMMSVQEKLQEKETDRLSARSYLEEIEKQFSVAMAQPQLDLPFGEHGEEENPLPTFQPVPVQAARAQRGRMTSQQIEEMVLGDILRSHGMKDFEWPETNQEYNGRKRKPRMEIDRSVLMALLGHDSSTYVQ